MAITFTQYVDSRLHDARPRELLSLLKKRIELIDGALQALPTVEFGHEAPNRIKWDDDTFQWRVTYWVIKRTRTQTWKEIYAAIDMIQPVLYAEIKTAVAANLIARPKGGRKNVSSPLVDLRTARAAALRPAGPTYQNQTLPHMPKGDWAGENQG